MMPFSVHQMYFSISQFRQISESILILYIFRKHFYFLYCLCRCMDVVCTFRMLIPDTHKQCGCDTLQPAFNEEESEFKLPLWYKY